MVQNTRRVNCDVPWQGSYLLNVIINPMHIFIRIHMLHIFPVLCIVVHETLQIKTMMTLLS